MIPQFTNPISIPGTIEFYACNGKVYCRKDGNEMMLSDAPVIIHEMIQRDIDRHPGAQDALEFVEIKSTAAQHDQYVACMYGELNDTPDFINFHRNMQDAEFVQLICGVKDCPHRGILCHKIHALYGELTDRETEVCFWLSHDFTHEEIAEQMSISINTVHVHIANIMPKIGCNSSKGIAAWAAIHLRNPKH